MFHYNGAYSFAAGYLMQVSHMLGNYSTKQHVLSFFFLNFWDSVSHPGSSWIYSTAQAALEHIIFLPQPFVKLGFLGHQALLVGLVPIGPNPNVPISCCFVVLFFIEVSVCCLFEAVTLSPSCTGAVCSVSTLTICLRLYLINVKPPVLSWNSIVWTKRQVSVWRFLGLKGQPSMIYFLKEGALTSYYSLINTLKATFTTLPQIRFKKCPSLYTQYFLELVLHFLISHR